MYFFSKVDYRIYQRFYKLAYWLSIILLIVVLIVGTDSHGAKRWIDLKIITFQPSEIVKILILQICWILLFTYIGKKIINKQISKVVVQGG